MKKYLIALLMLMALTTTLNVAAQSHRHTQRTPATTATAQPDTAGVEAFSDTTAVDTADVSQSQTYNPMSMDEDDWEDMIGNSFGVAGGMIGTLLILLILFVLSPVAILIVLFYFIYKSRKQKLQIAEMAMKNGQPIPNDLLKSSTVSSDAALWSKGIKNIFLGLGLICFFGILGAYEATGIGLLIMFYGIGQAVISKTSQGKKRKEDELNDVDDNTRG